MSVNATLTTEPELSESDIERAQEDLRRRFARSGGCIGRASDFARLYPTSVPACVEEALHRLAEDGAVHMTCLADGTFAFRFPPG